MYYGHFKKIQLKGFENDYKNIDGIPYDRSCVCVSRLNMMIKKT
jgi:hypothetical protein